MFDKSKIEKLMDNKSLGLKKDEIEWLNFHTKAKMDFIAANEFQINLSFINLEKNQIGNKIPREIIDMLNDNFHFVYQLNGNEILEIFINYYKQYFIAKIEELYNSIQYSEAKDQLISIKLQIFYVIEFWECILNYHENYENLGIVHFTPNYVFQFDFSKISNFMKILKTEHLHQYANFLKFTFATNITNLNTLEFDYKLKYLIDYHQQYDSFGVKPFTRYNILNITYSTFLKIGLKNDFTEFEKSSFGKKITLRFQKSNLLDVKTPFVYLIGIILSKLENNIKIKDFDFTKISIQIIGDDNSKKIHPYKEVMFQKDKHIKNNTDEENVEEQLKSKFDYYKRWTEELNQLNLFRNSLTLNNNKTVYVCFLDFEHP